MTQENDATADSLTRELDRLGTALHEFPNKAKFTDQHGANGTPLDCQDIAFTAEGLGKKISSIDWSPAEDIDAYFGDFKEKIKWAADNLVPQIHANPNLPAALLSTLYSIDMQLASKITPGVIEKSLLLPAGLRRDAVKAQNRLKAASLAIDGVENKLNIINDAHSAALNLPATQSDLEQAVKDIEESRASVLRYESDVKQSTANASEIKAQLETLQKNASETMARVDEAYRASTSDGLARSFKARANSLNWSMYIWAASLVGALVAAIWLGFHRFPYIMAAVNPATNSPVNWGVVAVQALISVLSLGPAVWLAWVATKQIGQRFRLSEDYAYKAALAAAYEGYRSEAINIDPQMQAQLFSIALTRLDEIPLRLVDQHIPGSPMHELINSKEFREATDKIPALKTRLMSILNRQPKITTPKEAPEPKTES